MTHLTVEEIIKFVSFDALNKDTVALAAKVNGHIRSCKSCFEKVSSFQAVYNGLCRSTDEQDDNLISEDEIKEILDGKTNKGMGK